MRSEGTDSNSPHHGYVFGEFVLDIDRAALLHNGNNVGLRPKSLDVLIHLVEHHGRLVEKDELLEAVWAGTAVTDDSLTHCLIDIRKVLGDIKRVYPAYNAKASYELAGMVWFQGWNDMVDSGTYPTRGQPGSYDAYSNNLAHFIRDVRRDLKAPKLPFVIGVMGAGGPIANYSPDQMRYAGIHGEFRKAMAAPTKLPEFKGNVTAVFTENYWDGQLSELVDRRGKINAKRRELAKDQSLTRAQRDKAIAEFTDEIYTREEQAILEAGVSNAAYHYLGSAKILSQIGQAFAEALVAME